MSSKDIAIKVENLSKRYRIGLKEEMNDSIGTAIFDFIKSPLRNYRKYRSLYRFDDVNPSVKSNSDPNSSDIIWALRNVYFEVKIGDVLGIIGGNGAGKSTLLKILSRITDPTSGNAEIRGRVASLLEVGTGFHQELTGRENVYLNGTILGMTKKEVDHKFDEIVDFSGVEKFIDTPVKRYSSGMKVRLAFSVAAHLEPEVLMVDEVLAVGDTEFQEKCLGKMDDIGKSGRTVLLVSHNMAAIQSLCNRCFVLKNGELIFEGLAGDAIEKYLEQFNPDIAGRLSEYEKRDGDGRARFTSLGFEDNWGNSIQSLQMGEDLNIKLGFRCNGSIQDPRFSVILKDQLGHRMIAARSHISFGKLPQSKSGGIVTCKIPSVPLLPGRYFATISLYDGRNMLIDRLRDISNVRIIPANIYGTGQIPDLQDCLISPAINWIHDYE